MKQGQTVLAYVIAAVLILAFAGTALFAQSGRLHRAPGIVESLLPEKCITTGLTRDEYQAAINDAMLEIPKPRAEEALRLYKEMKACFADAEISPAFLEAAQKGVSGDLAPFMAAYTRSGLKEVLHIYDMTKGTVPLDKWTAAELLLFARALHHLDQGRAQDAADILMKASEKEDATDAQKAEARVMLAFLLAKDSKQRAKAQELMEKVVKEFGKSTDVDVQLFVGRAKLFLGQPSGVNAIDAARATATSGYLRQEATYALGAYAVDTGAFADAAVLEGLVHVRDAAYHDDAVAKYVLIPPDARAVNDCAANVLATADCICKTPAGSDILPAGDVVYCCTQKPYAKPCACLSGYSAACCAGLKSMQKNCEAYETEATCGTDPCAFASTGYGVISRCFWEEAGCVKSTISAGPPSLK